MTVASSTGPLWSVFIPVAANCTDAPPSGCLAYAGLSAYLTLSMVATLLSLSDTVALNVPTPPLASATTSSYSTVAPESTLSAAGESRTSVPPAPETTAVLPISAALTNTTLMR
ncbi:hypothetical protein GOC77_02365 [Haloarcula argentinensis]|uniref:Uncharacterized protein n=1 Tax=Haloarcula argentinensis TaxID=43776 RepID=A0A847UKA0_HALAR|nr:hypothetical protein [Haloarcula argentinensis]